VGAVNRTLRCRACAPRQASDDLCSIQQPLGTVARRQSQVQSQEVRLLGQKVELHDPQLFLPRLRNSWIAGADEWWYDRDALREGCRELIMFWQETHEEAHAVRRCVDIVYQIDCRVLP